MPGMTNAKAIMGSVLTALAAVATWGGLALDDGTIGGKEWFGLLGVVVAALAGYLGVYLVPNHPKPGAGLGPAAGPANGGAAVAVNDEGHEAPAAQPWPVGPEPGPAGRVRTPPARRRPGSGPPQ